MRFLLMTMVGLLMISPAAANTIRYWETLLSAKGLKPAKSKTAKLNTRNRRNYIVKIDERDLVKQMARISRKSAREEAYIHVSDTIALETGRRESFKVFTSNCLVRATVQSSIKIDDLLSGPKKTPAKIVWYHVHPSRKVINARFRGSGCQAPSTWPILPSSADLSWFLERARKYYAARPDGLYMDRIVVHPLGVIEMALTQKGKSHVRKFKWTDNYSTQENGNYTMPGYRLLPQRVIQILGQRIDRFKHVGQELEAEIEFAVGRLSTEMLKIRFIPMRDF